jgi:hypothetical protein
LCPSGAVNPPDVAAHASLPSVLSGKVAHSKIRSLPNCQEWLPFADKEWLDESEVNVQVEGLNQRCGSGCEVSSETFHGIPPLALDYRIDSLLAVALMILIIRF